MKILKSAQVLFIAMLFIAGDAHSQIPGSVMSEEKTEALVIDFTENPCPNPRQALSNTPNDLKVIQEDITRFTLCLKRAQLLSRLNDLASENIDSLNNRLDNRLNEMMGDYVPDPILIPQIQAPQMPSMAGEIMSEAGQKSMPIPELNPVEDQAGYKNWTINEIKGQNGELVAMISDDSGALINVKAGDTIPDTAIEVISISQISVQIKEDNETAKLKWSQ